MASAVSDLLATGRTLIVEMVAGTELVEEVVRRRSSIWFCSVPGKCVKHLNIILGYISQTCLNHLTLQILTMWCRFTDWVCVPSLISVSMAGVILSSKARPWAKTLSEPGVRDCAEAAGKLSDTSAVQAGPSEDELSCGPSIWTRAASEQSCQWILLFHLTVRGRWNSSFRDIIF